MTLQLRGSRPEVEAPQPPLVDRNKFRGDIEGMRAIAVALVLLYHAGLPISGGYIGVDVFFVISGYLITSLLLKEINGTGSISLLGFYGRRAKRLLPATAAMLLATAFLTYLFIPKIRWVGIAHDIIGSGLYVQNWRLASLAVDYNAQGQATSPLQHFWSLAVEEQFYLVWPVLMLVVTLWARPRSSDFRKSLLSGRSKTGERNLVAPLLMGFVLVAVPSLFWSAHLTAANPEAAYFVTTTRLWELAVGGGVAILASRLSQFPMTVALLLGWSGLAAVLVSAFVFQLRRRSRDWLRLSRRWELPP